MDESYCIFIIRLINIKMFQNFVCSCEKLFLSYIKYINICDLINTSFILFLLFMSILSRYIFRVLIVTFSLFLMFTYNLCFVNINYSFFNGYEVVLIFNPRINSEIITSYFLWYLTEYWLGRDEFSFLPRTSSPLLLFLCRWYMMRSLWWSLMLFMLVALLLQLNSLFSNDS